MVEIEEPTMGAVIDLFQEGSILVGTILRTRTCFGASWGSIHVVGPEFCERPTQVLNPGAKPTLLTIGDPGLKIDGFDLHFVGQVCLFEM